MWQSQRRSVTFGGMEVRRATTEEEPILSKPPSGASDDLSDLPALVPVGCPLCGGSDCECGETRLDTVRLQTAGLL